MGTSANVILIAGEVDEAWGTEELWFYRSYDGHPENVRPMLKKLLKEAKKRRISGDLDSMAHLFITEVGKSPDNDFRVTASTYDRRCSSEYLYFVDVTNERIKTLNTCGGFNTKLLDKFKSQIFELLKERWKIPA
jgi:hypothetical protein